MSVGPRPKERAPAEAKPKKSGLLVKVLVGLVIFAGAFLGGAYYFTATRSTTFVAIAASRTDSTLVLYRPTSGEADRFCQYPGSSATASIPLANSFSVKDSSGKKVAKDSWTVEEGREIAVSVTVDPKGKVQKIEELGDSFVATGTVATVKGDEVEVAGKKYSADNALLVAFGVPLGTGSESIRPGDAVRLLGHGKEAFTIELVERAGTVAVTSDVAAKVYIDGSLAGKTPLVAPASPGERTIMVKAEGYRDHKGSIQVLAGTTTEYAVTLEPLLGTVFVSSTPEGATVFLDGENKGRTPQRITVPVGECSIRLELSGYTPATASVTVGADAEESLVVTLRKDIGLPDTPGSVRPVRVTSVSASEMRFSGKYPSGYSDTFRVTDKTTVDGWPATRSTLEKLFPGEEVQVTLAGDGTVRTLTKTSSHTFTISGQVGAQKDSTLLVGPGWTKCVLAWDAVVHDGDGRPYARTIGPGDVITGYGPSADDIRYVKVETPFQYDYLLEGYLVHDGGSSKVFGDSYLLGIHVPADLLVGDPEKKGYVEASEVPSGSRVRFYIGESGETIRADIMWRANVSADGILTSLAGYGMTVGGHDGGLTLDANALFYRDVSRTYIYNLVIGDTILAAGPSPDSIRFVWARGRTTSVRKVTAVVATLPGRLDTAIFEYGPTGLGQYPYKMSPDATLSYPTRGTTLRASDLVPGDRLDLWVDEGRQVVWGEITQKAEILEEGVYLGVRSGYTYISGMRRFDVRSDFLVVGLGKGEVPEPGARVLVAGAGGVLTYMEIRSYEKPSEVFKGTLLSSQGVLRVRREWGIPYGEFEIGTWSWFVDWTLMEDGPASQLFPGDGVSVHASADQDAVFVERTYSPPWKTEGVVKTRQGNTLTLILGDGETVRTMEVSPSAMVWRNGAKVNLYQVQTGDPVRASGPDKDHVDLVVVGW